MKTFKFYAQHNNKKKDKIQIPGNNNNLKYIQTIYFQLYKHRSFLFNSRHTIIIFIEDHITKHITNKIVTKYNYIKFTLNF